METHGKWMIVAFLIWFGTRCDSVSQSLYLPKCQFLAHSYDRLAKSSSSRKSLRIYQWPKKINKKMLFNVCFFLPAQTSWFSTTTFNLLLLRDNQWKRYLLIQWHFQGIRAHSWGRSECAPYHRQISETSETKPSNTVVDLLFEHGEWIKCFPPNIQHVTLDLQLGHGSACLCVLLQTEHVLGLLLNLNVLCMFQRHEIRQLRVSPIVLC